MSDELNKLAVKGFLKGALSHLKNAKILRKPLPKSNEDRSYNQVIGAVKLLLQGADKNIGPKRRKLK